MATIIAIIPFYHFDNSNDNSKKIKIEVCITLRYKFSGISVVLSCCTRVYP